MEARKRSNGGREENGWGGSRPRAGRPRKEAHELSDKAPVAANLSQEDREYLAKWGDGNTAALRELIARARKFWPNGV